jgi:hypothetical protein
MIKGGPIGIVAGLGLLVLDGLEIANSCEFIQEGYYELFLKSSDVTLKPVQRSSRAVNQDDVYHILQPTLPTAHQRLMCAGSG